MGADQFGSSDKSRRISPKKIKKARRQSDRKCCPMVEAVHSVKRGKFKLARRYAAMSVRLIAARVV
jgi:hypothetical protein